MDDGRGEDPLVCLCMTTERHWDGHVIRLPPALRHRQFTLIWVGLIISMVGSQMQQWALFWHISQLSSEPIAVSIVGGVRFVAVLAFSMVGGLVADRYNRRAILFITQSMSLLVALVLGLLTLFGRDPALAHLSADGDPGGDDGLRPAGASVPGSQPGARGRTCPTPSPCSPLPSTPVPSPDLR